MAKPKAPSGLTVERNKDKYVISWKLPKKYKAQELYYTIDGGAKHAIAVTKTDTTKTETIAKSGFYPKTATKATNILFSVRGKVGSKWSDETKKTYSISTPPKPVVVANYSNENESTTTFDFAIDWSDPTVAGADSYSVSKDTTNAMFTNFQWWTSLLPNSELESDQVTTWQETGTMTDDTDSTYKTITETTPFSGSYSYTRYFKVVARGPAGDSKPAYGKHVYAFPNAAKNVKASAVPLENGQGYRISASWTADETKSRPIDSILVQYAIATPTSSYTDSSGVRKTTLSVPTIEESSWQTGATVKDTTDSNGDVDGAVFVVSPLLTADKCIFVRVVTKHDNKSSYSNVVFVDKGYGALTAPVISSSSISNSNVATITLTNGSALTASFVGIYYRTDLATTPQLVGIWPAGRSAALTVQLPDPGEADNVSLGVQTFVADYTPISAAQSGVTNYAVTNIKMQSSGIVWDSRSVPKPPTKIELSSPRTGVVRITWDWAWQAANGVELSWADHDDAWESTDGPQTYVLEDTRASAWNVAGLDVGMWYFRIRLFKVDGEATTYGTYSDIKSIKLASSPATPVLTLSPTIVTPDGKVTCYWAFTATDGDEQVQADICEATLSDTGAATYGTKVAKASNEQYKTLDIKSLGWAAGTKHFLAVKVVTASGEESNNWSVPKPVQVLSPITCTISSTSLTSRTVETVPRKFLTSMPLTVTATGAGKDGTITYILERAEDYHLDRPDESEASGFAGETIAIIQKSADNTNSTPNYSVSIGMDDLLGPLDDGAKYNLIAIAQDSYGQTSKAGIEFQVDWSHQAIVPSATIEVNNEDMAVFITPVAPTGTATGDTCDIYRLSPDKPELIVSNAAFGTKYVDPYPSLGKSGGHRIVFRTATGDYITSTNEFAWTDYTAAENDVVDVFATVIDFGEDQVVLPYDLSLNNTWSKDFTKTKYLGGSIQGDWNFGVDRTGSVKGRVAVEHDPELVSVIRKLANYAGICHVRTPDGSSYAANVDVTEDREEKKINMIASFSFNITKVDAQSLDGMLYTDWIKDA